MPHDRISSLLTKVKQTSVEVNQSILSSFSMQDDWTLSVLEAFPIIL